MEPDGTVTIQASIEEKGIDKGIENISNKLEKLRKKAEEPYEIDGIKVTGGWNLTDKEQKYYDRLSASLQQLEAERAGLFEVEKQITQETQKQNNVVEQQNSAIENQKSKNVSNKEKIAELSYELEEMLNQYKAMQNQDIVSSQDVNEIKELKNEILKVKKEYEELTGTKLHIKGITDTKKDLSSIGKSLSNSIKKVGRWAVAIFGIRTAYNAVRSAMNTISQYDEQLATDIEYIKNALAFTLEPIVRGIVNLIKQLMYYVGYITEKWTGTNIFENANKSLKNANKNAQKLSKTLSGFDEMNVLNDSGTTGTMEATTPSFDLTAPEDAPIPGWIDFIAKNKDIIIGALSGIGSALVAMKLSDFAVSLGLVKTGLKGIQTLGIGIMIAGIVMSFKDIIDLINNPSWENFAALLGSIAIAIGGIMLIMGNWWGLLIVIIGLVVKLVAENWEKIKEILGTVGGWIYENIIIPVGILFQELINTIDSILDLAISIFQGVFTTIFHIIINPFIIAKETIAGVFNGVLTIIRGVFDVISGLFTGDWQKVMNGFKQIFKGTFDTLWSIAKAPLNLVIGGINALIRGVNKIKFDVPDWVPVIGGGKWGFNIPTIPKLAVGGIVNMPSRGVPIGGAIAGEAGREGVIPLTNSQAMEELGATIGRYITINANITNTMNGRVISRELQKIQNDSDFARNG